MPLPIALAVPDARKQALLRQLGVECDGECVQIEAQEGSLDQLLLAARVHCLSKVRAGRGAGRGGAGRPGGGSSSVRASYFAMLLDLRASRPAASWARWVARRGRLLSPAAMHERPPHARSFLGLIDSL